MSALVLALAVMTGVAGSGPLAPDVWITIDRDVLTAFESGGEAWESRRRTALGDPVGSAAAGDRGRA